MTGEVSFCCFRRRAIAMGKPAPVEASEASAMKEFFQQMGDLKSVRFTKRQLDAFTNNYSKPIGSGGYGKVYKGELPTGVVIAVKVLTERKNVKSTFISEVSTIGRIRHANLVKLYGYCYDPLLKALVYEFMEKGSLDKYLFTEDSDCLIPWPTLLQIAVGTAKGLAHLHEGIQPRLIHYDIKPGNVLLDCDFSAKVADFGLANLCNADGSHARLIGCRGTPGYLAPEFILMNSPISHKCDVYSFGILLFEIVGRRRNTRIGESGESESIDWFPKKVWEEYEKGELAALIDSKGVPEEHRAAAERVAVVALWCVQDSPEARPEMSDVVMMLEGRAEILRPPPRPFRYMYALEKSTRPPSSDWDSGDSPPTSSSQSNPSCYS